VLASLCTYGAGLSGKKAQRARINPDHGNGTRPGYESGKRYGCLERIGYRALWFENATLERLLDLLAHDWPVIVFLRAADLPHGHAGLHAMVLVAIGVEQVTCLDPSLDQPLTWALSPFLSSWRILGSQGLIVWVA
jgi:hypothetical protein